MVFIDFDKLGVSSTAEQSHDPLVSYLLSYWVNQIPGALEANDIGDTSGWWILSVRL